MAINYTSRATPRGDLGEVIKEYSTSGYNFIAEQILPVRPVALKAANLSVLQRENLKREDAAHSNGAAFNRINLKAEDTSYACVDYGLEIGLTDDDRASYDTDFDAEVESVQLIADKIALEQEYRVASAIFNTTTWTGASLYTDNSGSPWDTVTTNIITQVVAAKEKVRANTGMSADTMIIGAATLNNILKNTAILARFPGNTIISEEVLRSNLASIFGLQNLLVGNAVYDGAKDGQSFSGSDVWSDDYAMVCKVNTGSVKSGGLGRTLVWTPMDEAGVVQYREEQTESDIFRVRQYQQEKVFDASFGHLMKIDV